MASAQRLISRGVFASIRCALARVRVRTWLQAPACARCVLARACGMAAVAAASLAAVAFSGRTSGRGLPAVHVCLKYASLTSLPRNCDPTRQRANLAAGAYPASAVHKRQDKPLAAAGGDGDDDAAAAAAASAAGGSDAAAVHAASQPYWRRLRDAHGHGLHRHHGSGGADGADGGGPSSPFLPPGALLGAARVGFGGGVAQPAAGGGGGSGELRLPLAPAGDLRAAAAAASSSGLDALGIGGEYGGAGEAEGAAASGGRGVSGFALVAAEGGGHVARVRVSVRVPPRAQSRRRWVSGAGTSASGGASGGVLASSGVGAGQGGGGLATGGGSLDVDELLNWSRALAS